MKSKHMGSTLSSFLDEEGIREEVDLRAKKKILTDQILANLERDHVTKTELASRMNTSRTVVNRLLDPNDTSFTFGTLAKALIAQFGALAEVADRGPGGGKASTEALRLEGLSLCYYSLRTI